MSWSSSAYPPPRRSRSRSPYRGSYPPSRPPHSDSHPPDQYRTEWDVYDRDRAWAYDRDRAAYDYGRRGRSRSPPPEEGAGRKRRRSISPSFERDRYEPRPRYADDYDTHSRGYGYASPPRRGAYPPPSRRAPPDPHTFEYPATLKQYAEWFRFFYPQQATEEDNADKAAEHEAGDGTKPRNGIKSRWEKYKKKFAASQLQTMFDHHRKSPWFAEKYDPAPEYEQLRKRIRKEGWKGRANAFLLTLEAGEFDPPLDNSVAEPTSPAKEIVPKEEADINDTVKEEPTDAGNGLGPNDESMKVEEDGAPDADDDGGDKGEVNGKASDDAKRNNGRGDEIAVYPEGHQVMIRTIPPDIGRIKLETLGALDQMPGFVYLALGDPLQKRNYYRAGWLKFREDTDMTAIMAELNEKKIDGFKLHVLHNTHPFKNRIRYAPDVASRPDRLEKDLANAKVLATQLEAEAQALRKFKIPPATDAANGNTVEEDVTMSVGEDDPDDSEPKENMADAIERRVERVLADLRESGLVNVNDEAELNLRKTEISLDFYLAYLRAAFNTCYYCAIVTDHMEELQRKCIKHVRKPISKAALEEYKAAVAEKAQKVKEVKEEEGAPEKEKEPPAKEDPSDIRDWRRNDERWLDWLDSKIALLINRDGVDPRQYGGKSYDEELSKAVEPYVKQEDEGKYRCKTCQKLFKATSFVEKHIANKHGELVKQLDEIPYFNNFALDPHHIQPFSHPPPSTGSGQPPPPQAYGLQGPPPPPFPPGDYGRGAPFYPPPHGQGYPPPHLQSYPPNGGYWDPQAFPHPLPNSFPAREAPPPRRLSDRISGYAPGFDHTTEPTTVPASAGLPPKPIAAALDSSLADEVRVRKPATSRRGTRGSDAGGPPPPPPPDAKEDPRAAAGKKVSYHDMDLVAEGDIELQY
ncbi:hypothetical protein BV25DRAFT_1818065 [Artomyces pyxidatus]|uniref:Uncharacterized protein n=1 Tax=Artomyces pyxidatus TaxID=48021 RepID=A0ACB8TL35_9AGAM|nr:hypothetical protein BV25DRAFT_1818065 [Artomyces pyxidatus]